MATKDNLAIKIPDSHYVGFQKRSSDEVPLGFMTPDGKDKAAEKRKATVDGWAGGYSYYSQKQATLPSKTFDNKPLVGFKMGKNISYGSGWNSRHDKWRIEDPRGFELEITSGNLQEIISDCTIERGEILEECIWGRLGSENILIPVASEVYKRATANTKRMATSASVRDLKPGSYFTMKNGERCWFAARCYVQAINVNPQGDDDRYYYHEVTTPQVYNPTDKSLFAYVRVGDKTIEEAMAKSQPSIHLRSSLNLSLIEMGDEITNAEGIKWVNNQIHTRGESCIDGSSNWGYRHNGFAVLQVTEKLEPTLPVQLEIREYKDISELMALAPTPSESVYARYTIFEHPKVPNQLLRKDFRSDWKNANYTSPFGGWIHSKTNEIEAYVLDHEAFFKNRQVIVKKQAHRSGYWGGSSHFSQMQTKVDHTDLNNVKMYKLFIKYVDSTGFAHEVDVTYG